MTNLMIVCMDAFTNQVFTEEQIEEYLVISGGLPLYTFQEWKKKGYAVKKGEHARLTCYLWQKTVPYTNREGKTIIPEKAFRRVKAFLFTEEQVKKLA